MVHNLTSNKTQGYKVEVSILREISNADRCLPEMHLFNSYMEVSFLERSARELSNLKLQKSVLERCPSQIEVSKRVAKRCLS